MARYLDDDFFEDNDGGSFLDPDEDTITFEDNDETEEEYDD